MASGGRPPHSTPSLSLRSPSSTPSLSLRSPFTVPSDSLQTPDTSSLFISSLAGDRASQGSGFTSLEDLLNFTGISHQMPSPTLSLESLARDMEQSQGPVLSAGPPEAKRLRLNVNPVTTSTAHSSPLPPNIRVSTLPSFMAPAPQATDVPNLASSWSLKTSSAPIPSLFPSSSSSSFSSSVLLSSTSQPSATTTTGIPLYNNSALATSAPSRAQTLSQFTVSPPFPGYNLASLTAGAPLGSSGGLLSTAATPMAASAKTSSSLRSHSPVPSSSPVSSRALAQGPSLPQYPFPTSLASSFPIPSPTAISSVTTSPNPLPTSSISQCPSVSGSAAGSSVGTASSAAQPARTAAPAGPLPPTALSVPSHPAQRALLVQLIQAYRQCSALGDVQGQVRVRAQLNLLLQAQQKVGGANSTHPVAPNAAQRPPLSTPSPVSQGPPAPFTHTLVNHTSQVKQFGQPKAPLTSTPSLTPPSLTPPLTPSLNRSLPQAPPIAASLLANQGKSLDSAANRGVAMATNSLPSQIVAMGTIPHSVAMATTAGAAPVLSSSSADHTVAPITPSHGRALPSSGPASALKAAATSLYNLRLKQLQLFLQSLPEEERPRSIPELKALLQSSGGQLSALAQPAGSVGPSLPNPSTTPQSTQRAPATQPMAISMPAVIPTLLSTTAMQQPATGLPLSTNELPSTDQSSSSLVFNVPSSGSAFPTGGLPSLAVPTGLPQLANSFSLSGSAQHLPTNSWQQPLSTSLASASSQQPPAASNTGPATTSIPVTTDKAYPPLPSSAPLAPPTTAGHNEPIKPGVPTPLPPGLNPETLAVLCRMPDAELQKLNLPVALTTAIRMWRGQHSTGAQRGRKPASHQNAGLPVIIPPSRLLQPHSSPSTPVSTSQSSQALPAFNTQTSQPIMIPLSEGFPPRSLHAYVPGVTVGNCQSNMRNAMPPPTYSTTSLPPPRGHTPSRPLTRHQLRAEQTKVEKERAAVLNKVLQTSEEARIAYRFNMLTDKMTNQLMTPDSHTPFKSLHDVIARLLPYHMWSEAEPPPGAIEKADAVYESVAQVLMSRCHGLMSHYQHLIYHDAQRDSEAVMGVYLERLFLESEKERKEKENQERQQAAQIAADLSLIAGDSSLNFDPDFSLGDVMNSDPMLTFDPGIT